MKNACDLTPGCRAGRKGTLYLGCREGRANPMTDFAILMRQFGAGTTCDTYDYPSVCFPQAFIRCWVTESRGAVLGDGGHTVGLPQHQLLNSDDTRAPTEPTCSEGHTLSSHSPLMT